MRHSDEMEEWPRAWTRAIGEEIARRRKDARLSQTALCEEVERLGYPLARHTLVGLETGRREAVNVHEVVAVAEALGVLPIDLLFPRTLDRGHPQGVEYLPGQHAVAWLGKARFNGQQTDLDEVLNEISGPAQQVAELVRNALIQSEERHGILNAPEPDHG